MLTLSITNTYRVPVPVPYFLNNEILSINRQGRYRYPYVALLGKIRQILGCRVCACPLLPLFVTPNVPYITLREEKKPADPYTGNKEFSSFD